MSEAEESGGQAEEEYVDEDEGENHVDQGDLGKDEVHGQKNPCVQRGRGHEHFSSCRS